MGSFKKNPAGRGGIAGPSGGFLSVQSLTRRSLTRSITGMKFLQRHAFYLGGKAVVNLPAVEARRGF